jgi:hypothetical protein
MPSDKPPEVAAPASLCTPGPQGLMSRSGLWSPALAKLRQMPNRADWACMYFFIFRLWNAAWPCVSSRNIIIVTYDMS